MDTQQLEWHPLSVAGYQEGVLTFAAYVSGCGKWTNALRDYASTLKGAQCTINIEGPYGYDWYVQELSPPTSGLHPVMSSYSVV
jgi:NAD(P)H-flavin reductase